MKQSKLISDVTSFTSDELLNFDFQLEKSAVAKLATRLTDLYKNPIEATVRELVSNAIDSSIKMNGKVRIELDQSEFVVTDTGLGMSYEDLKNIYTSYGTSTKAEDFSAIGAFGLGAKSPLAYTTNFIIKTTTKEEIIEGVVTRTEELPKLVITKREPNNTNTQTGTIIKVPILERDDYYSFRRYVNNYEKYKDLIDVDIEVQKTCEQNKTNEYHFYKLYNVDLGRNLTAEVFTPEKNIHLDGADVSFLIGGWKYNNINNTNLIVKLPYGVVDFSSSRDEIIKNSRFQEVLSKIEEAHINNAQECFENLKLVLSEESLLNTIKRNPKYFKKVKTEDKILQFIINNNDKFFASYHKGKWTSVTKDFFTDDLVIIANTKYIESFLKTDLKNNNLLFVLASISNKELKNSGYKFLKGKDVEQYLLENGDLQDKKVYVKSFNCPTKKLTIKEVEDLKDTIFVKEDEDDLRSIKNMYPRYNIAQFITIEENIVRNYLKNSNKINYIKNIEHVLFPLYVKKLEKSEFLNRVKGAWISSKSPIDNSNSYCLEEKYCSDIESQLESAKEYYEYLSQYAELLNINSALSDSTIQEDSVIKSLQKEMNKKLEKFKELEAKEEDKLYNSYLEEYNKRSSRNFTNKE